MAAPLVDAMVGHQPRATVVPGAERLAPAHGGVAGHRIGIVLLVKQPATGYARLHDLTATRSQIPLHMAPSPRSWRDSDGVGSQAGVYAADALNS